MVSDIQTANKSAVLSQKAAPIRAGPTLLTYKSMTENESDTDSSDVECPTCGRDDFKSSHGMKVHHKSQHGESLALIKTDCPECGQSVECYQSQLKSDEGKFCSTECRDTYHSKSMRGENHPRYNRVDTECTWCGSELTVEAARYENCVNNFCDLDCRGKWQSEAWVGENSPTWEGGDIVVSCAWCGGKKEVAPHQAESRKRHFCSRTCMSKWQAEQWSGDGSPRWDSEYIPCANCGEDVKTKSHRIDLYEHRFCGVRCKAEWQTENLIGEGNPRWDGGPVLYGGGWTQQKRETVRNRQDRRCASCGKHESENARRLDVHHIQKARAFDDDEVRNDESNLVALCRSCHREWEQMSPLRPQTPYLD